MIIFAMLVELMSIPLLAITVAVACSTYWIWTVNSGRTIQAFIGFALSVSIALAFFNFNPITYVFDGDWKHIILTVIMYVGGYFAVGVVWGAIKWKLMNIKISNLLVGEPEKYASKRTSDTWNEYAGAKIRSAGILSHRQEYPIRVYEHLARITCWMLYWPPSFVWSIFGDVIYTVYLRFVILVSQIFQGTADRHADVLAKKVVAAKTALAKDTERLAGTI